MEKSTRGREANGVEAKKAGRMVEQPGSQSPRAHSSMIGGGTMRSSRRVSVRMIQAGSSGLKSVPLPGRGGKLSGLWLVEPRDISHRTTEKKN